MSMESLHKVWEVQALKKMPDNQQANDLLNRLVQATSNILTGRKWKVKVLREFYPKNKSLLGMNVNHGQAILIRLRHPHDQNRFLEWHDILGTMCHELAHMAISAHNADFYKLWDELSDEVERLGKSSYYNPNGTNGWGSTAFVKLGGKSVNRQFSRDIALTAALKRQKLDSSGSGHRLGGSMAGKQLNPIELRNLIASAAERRIQDDKWCPTQNIDDFDESHVLTDDNHDSGNWVCSVCTEENTNGHCKCKFCGIDNRSQESYVLCEPCEPVQSTSSSSRSKSSLDMYDLTIPKDPNAWTCIACTFVNEYATKECLMCYTLRDIDDLNESTVIDNNISIKSKDEIIHSVSNSMNRTWDCHRCTYINSTDDSQCVVCNHTNQSSIPFIDLT